MSLYRVEVSRAERQISVWTATRQRRDDVRPRRLTFEAIRTEPDALIALLKLFELSPGELGPTERRRLSDRG